MGVEVVRQDGFFAKGVGLMEGRGYDFETAPEEVEGVLLTVDVGIIVVIPDGDAVII